MSDKPREGFKRIVRFLAPYRGRVAGLLALTISLSVLAMAPPLLVKGVIDGVLTEGRREHFWPLILGLFLVPVIAAACRYLQTLGVAYIGQHFVFDIRNALYQHLLRLSARFYGRFNTGMLVNRLMGDSGTVQQMVTAQSIGVLSDMTSALIALMATFYISWRLSLLMLLIIIVFVVNYRVSIGRIRHATKGYRGVYDRMSGGIQSRLTGAVAVKTFGTEGREHGAFQEAQGAGLEMVQEAMVAGNDFNMNTRLIHGAGNSILFFAGCALVLDGSISYGDVIAFTSYAMQLLWPCVRFSEIAKQLSDVRIAIERLMELFDEPVDIQDAPDAVGVGRLRGEVIFDHVQFEYEAGKPVLKDFSLEVRPGMTVALIGPTGCGKSTILSLVLRFFDINGGSLRLDGLEVRRIKLKSLRQQFGIVLQEPLLFDVSVRENIAYGRRGATQADIEAAAKVAEIHDFIVSLPQGYDTVLGSEGVEFSTGQRQRITIARAVLADPAILIMDEATSSLDSESERAIQTAMARVLKNRTCFVVAHRLSTVRNADNIVLLDKGVIVEQGTHDELMAIPDGRYQRLYNTHVGKGYIET